MQARLSKPAPAIFVPVDRIAMPNPIVFETATVWIDEPGLSALRWAIESSSRGGTHMSITIIGAGNMGSALAQLLSRAS